MTDRESINSSVLYGLEACPVNIADLNNR